MAASSQDTPTLKTYRGNCHCGAHIFEATVPDLETPGGKPSTCTCSICHKKGAIWSMVSQPSANFRWVSSDPSTLQSYRFGSKAFAHKFCSTCGTSLMFEGFMTPEAKEPYTGFNVRCLQKGLVSKDPWDMEVGEFDGRNAIGSPSEGHPFEGPEPEMKIENGVKYEGGCHCGAVRVALNSKPLDDKFDGGPIFECNCSGCIRAAGTCLYPDAKQLSITGATEENITAYGYGMKAWEKCFCKHCGIFVFRRPGNLPASALENLPEMAKKWTVDIFHLRPLNLRVIDRPARVDLKLLADSGKTTHNKGYEMIPIPYVNP